MLLHANLFVLLLSIPLPASSFELRRSNNAQWLGKSPVGDSKMKRDVVDGSLSSQSAGRPIGVRKMSTDEGEMFFPEYWRFETSSQGDSEVLQQAPLDKRKPILRLPEPESSNLPLKNASIFPPLQAPFSLHSDQPNLPLLRRLTPFQKRQFNCPTDTTACTSINRPNSCCALGETCQRITDTGNGDVGCCSQGQSCTQELTGCQDGYESCPGAQGGGCCVPGSSCMGVGCVINSTATVTIIPTATSLPSSPSSSLAPTTASTQTFTVATTNLVTVTGAPSHSSSSTNTPPHTTAISSPSPSATTSTTTHLASIPLRPTSAPPPTTTTAPTTCPTGFYACLALASPGCCRIGRDCATTSCPLASASTALASDGVTVGVAAVSTAGLGQGGCAVGWFGCTTGGGCCPSGYGCGAGSSCTASGVVTGAGKTGVAEVPRERSGAEGSRRVGLGGGWVAVVLLFGVVLVEKGLFA